MSLTDQHIDVLLDLCRKGNQLAQMEVYNRYCKAMYNTAVRILKDTAEAEDVMQESFITAFNKLDSFKGTATFGSWLKRIVVNNSIAQYRKSQRFVEWTSNLSVVGEDLEQDTYFEGILEEDYQQVKVSRVMSSMESLTTSYQQILQLHYVEGYDYEEICDIMEISYANCRTLLSRAKNSLRKKLNVPA